MSAAKKTAKKPAGAKAKKKLEKPSHIDEALTRLADGELLAEIAQSLGIKRTTLYMQLQATPALVDAYTRAREEGLHARGERLRLLAEEQVERTANGSLDSAAVAQLRLRVDVEKWTLAKLLPHVYGERVMQEHSGRLEIVTKEQRDAAVRAAMNADE